VNSMVWRLMRAGADRYHYAGATSLFSDTRTFGLRAHEVTGALVAIRNSFDSKCDSEPIHCMGANFTHARLSTSSKYTNASEGGDWTHLQSPAARPAFIKN
jgi:hypothetical protein